MADTFLDYIEKGFAVGKSIGDPLREKAKKNRIAEAEMALEEQDKAPEDVRATSYDDIKGQVDQGGQISRFFNIKGDLTKEEFQQAKENVRKDTAQTLSNEAAKLALDEKLRNRENATALIRDRISGGNPNANLAYFNKMAGTDWDKATPTFDDKNQITGYSFANKNGDTQYMSKRQWEQTKAQIMSPEVEAEIKKQMASGEAETQGRIYAVETIAKHFGGNTQDMQRLVGLETLDQADARKLKIRKDELNDMATRLDDIKKQFGSKGQTDALGMTVGFVDPNDAIQDALKDPSNPKYDLAHAYMTLTDKMKGLVENLYQLDPAARPQIPTQPTDQDLQGQVLQQGPQGMPKLKSGAEEMPESVKNGDATAKWFWSNLREEQNAQKMPYDRQYGPNGMTD